MLSRPLSAQLAKRVGIDHNDGIAAMQSYMLRAIAVGKAHQFAESRFGVLKTPAADRWLSRRSCFGIRFSSHAD